MRDAWLLIAVLGLSAVAAALPQPPPLACGDLIQTSIKLTRDLGPCPDYGIRIAASTPLTLDLNGHRIVGQGSGTGVFVFGESIVVKGPGRIVNFGKGIDVNHGHSVLIYDLDLIRNIDGVSLIFSSDVRILDNTIDGRDREQEASVFPMSATRCFIATPYEATQMSAYGWESGIQWFHRTSSLKTT